VKAKAVKARKLTANEQILNRLAELGERMRVIEDDIERAQKHLGRLAVHQGAVTALVPKLTTTCFGQAANPYTITWSGPDSNYRTEAMPLIRSSLGADTVFSAAPATESQMDAIWLSIWVLMKQGLCSAGLTPLTTPNGPAKPMTSKRAA